MKALSLTQYMVVGGMIKVSKNEASPKNFFVMSMWEGNVNL